MKFDTLVAECTLYSVNWLTNSGNDIRENVYKRYAFAELYKWFNNQFWTRNDGYIYL